MRMLKRKNYVWLMLAVLALGCGDKGNTEGAGSAISGIFGPSETEKNHSQAMKDQAQALKNQAGQMQKDRLGSY